MVLCSSHCCGVGKFRAAGLVRRQGVDTGGNFAWTTCGLSVGMSWDGCDKLYPTTLASLPTERAQSMFLFTQTWLNFTAHPTSCCWVRCGIILAILCAALGRFMLAGYIPLYSAASVDSYLVLLPLAVAIWFVWRKVSATERSFWIAMLASLPLSAGIVMMADGWRLLHVTHLFVAAFLALGFAVPPCRTRPKICASAELADRRGRARCIIVCLSFIPVFGALSGFGRASDASANSIFRLRMSKLSREAPG